MRSHNIGQFKLLSNTEINNKRDSLIGGNSKQQTHARHLVTLFQNSYDLEFETR